MKIVLDTSSSNQEFIDGLEELLKSSDGVTTQIIVNSEDECGIAVDAIDASAKRLNVPITWDKNIVLEDIPDVKGTELSEDEQCFYDRVINELDGMNGKLLYPQVKKVLKSMIDNIDIHMAE